MEVTLLAAHGTSKVGNSISECEDRFAVSDDRLVAAISDGASSSAYSGEWASCLVSRYLSNPVSRIGSRWATPAINEFASKLDYQSMPWHVISKLARGVHATLAGVRFDAAAATMSIVTVGDSCVAWVHPQSGHTQHWPKIKSAGFTHSPHLISTLNADNRLLYRRRRFLEHEKFDVGSTYVFLMTDAMAKWYIGMVEVGRQPWTNLLTSLDRSSFENLVDELRLEGALENDDVTVVILEVRRDAVDV